MAENGERREICELRWDDVACQGWYPEGELGSVWLSAYVAMGLDPAQLSEGPRILDFGDARAIVVYGQIPYVRLTNTDIRSTGTPQFHARVDEATAPEGGYLLVVTPFDDFNRNASETRCRSRVGQVVGLMVVVFGPNIAYRHLFDNVVRPQSNQRTAFGESFRAPFAMPLPDLAQQRIDLALDANTAIQTLPSAQANRVWLSLRWYLDAQSSKGVDLFLKLWFALEALGMEPRDNLSPIAVSLGRAYSVSPSQAKTRFSMGPLFGLRSRIVHQGEIRPIHALLSDYVAALYVDVLYDMLGLPPQHAAAEVQAMPGFDLNEFIG